jgi:cell division protein FtsI (penicillin-binding protein 3)
MYKKAGSELVDVAACGRRLQINDTAYRLELCGYFPVKNPQYTIMVVMEKENLPASAGGMCGPLFKRIAEGLLSH